MECSSPHTMSTTATTSGAALIAEGQLLSHLLREAAAVGSDDDDIEECEREMSAERHVQSMIDTYQAHVLKQKTTKHPAEEAGPVRSKIYAFNGHPPTPTPMSHSQPCLYIVDSNRQNGAHHSHSSETREKQHSGDSRSSAASATTAGDANAIKAENAMLRQRCDLLQRHTKKLRKLEMAYERIEGEFDSMAAHCERQTKLEQSMRSKLDQRHQRISKENETLRQEIEKLNTKLQELHPMPSTSEANAEHAMSYSRLVNEVLPQRQELLAIKKRQEMEIEAQNATLEDQRKHIETLEKALNNSQERIAARDRAAYDAMALVDKVAHQQKLLTEALDEKQRAANEHERVKAALEMEISQLKTQLENPSHRRSVMRLSDVDEMTRLRAQLASKDEQMAEEVARCEASSRAEIDALLTKVRHIETQRDENEAKCQALHEEKSRIHSAWAQDRRSLDHRVRQLEQDLRSLAASTTNSGGSGVVIAPNSLQQRVSPISARAATLHDSNAHKMEELRNKIADRRAANSWQFTRHQRNARSATTPTAPTHTRSASGDSAAPPVAPAAAATVSRDSSSSNTPTIPIATPPSIVSVGTAVAAPH